MSISAEEARVINNLLQELQLQVSRYQARTDPLVPTPFTPATTALDDAVANFKPLPYSAEEVQAVLDAVDKKIAQESRLAQVGNTAVKIIDMVRNIMPLVLGA